jgi:hypothetical protein
MDAKSKIEKVAKGVALGMTIYNHGKNLHNWYTNRNRYFATVEDDAFGYGELMAWLNERVTGKNYKFLVDRDGIARYLDAKEGIPVYIDGHKLTVSMGQDSPDSPMEAMGGARLINRREVLTFSSSGEEGIRALERLLDDLRKKAAKTENKTCLFSVGNYGWECIYLPKRTMGSVFLPEGVKEALLTDIDNFRNSPDDYDRVGIPWHRGYMLYGEPGNGKSSMTLALANELSMDLYTLNLSAVTNDKSLSALIGDVTNDSILLIEDIDIFTSTVSRNTEKETPTLAGLLNALDGVATPRGLITFITTNHVDSLDPALIRPGRIDYKLELTAPDDYQIRSMYRYVFDEELGVEPRKFDSMADLTNVFKMNLGDSEAVRLEIKA